MKTFLLYLMSFVLLDAFVPAGCRSERTHFVWGYEISDRTTEIEFSHKSIGELTRTTYFATIDSLYVEQREQDGSVSFYGSLPFTTEQFEELKQRLIACDIENEIHALSPEQKRKHGTADFDVITLDLYESNRLYYQGHYSECDTLREYSMNGNMDSLRAIIDDLESLCK